VNAPPPRPLEELAERIKNGVFFHFLFRSLIVPLNQKPRPMFNHSPCIHSVAIKESYTGISSSLDSLALCIAVIQPGICQSRSFPLLRTVQGWTAVLFLSTKEAEEGKAQPFFLVPAELAG